MISGVKLDASDRKRINEFWENVVNPACLKFAEDTGKPAEAFREAIAVGFDRHVKKLNQWNAWERVWWSKLPDDEDSSQMSTLLCTPLQLSSLDETCPSATPQVLPRSV